MIDLRILRGMHAHRARIEQEHDNVWHGRWYRQTRLDKL